MSAKIYYQTITPILAIIATPNFKKQQGNQTPNKMQKKRMSFSSYYQAFVDDEELIIYEPTDCYGPDGKPVINHASCFSKAL